MHSRRSTDLEIAIRMQIELLFMFVGCLFVCFFGHETVLQQKCKVK